MDEPTMLQLTELPGRTVAERYHLEACLASGLLTAVFRATELAGADAPLLLQLRRPWPAEVPEPAVELNDHLLLGADYTADVLATAEVRAAAGLPADADDAAVAAWLVAQADAPLGGQPADETAPEIPLPFAALELDPAWLEAVDASVLFDAMAAEPVAESPPPGTPEPETEMPVDPAPSVEPEPDDARDDARETSVEPEPDDAREAYVEPEPDDARETSVEPALLESEATAETAGDEPIGADVRDTAIEMPAIVVGPRRDP